MSVFDADEFAKNFTGKRPFFWMHEVSGKMRVIVRKFLEDRDLNPGELTILRWYVYQWVDAMPYKPDDYKEILSMDQKTLMDYVVYKLLEIYGIDPF